MHSAGGWLAGEMDNDKSNLGTALPLGRLHHHFNMQLHFQTTINTSYSLYLYIIINYVYL